LPGMEDYFSNPAETIYTLLKALPHVPESMQPELRTYIQNEWEYAPPSQYTHSGWGGAGREAYELSPTPLEYYSNSRQDPLVVTNADWEGFWFNPFNFYASWLYAKEFGEAKVILDEIRDKLEFLPPDSYLADKPRLLNIYIAGYTGFLSLQDLAGEPRSTEIESCLEDAKQKLLTVLERPNHELPGIEFGGFLYLVPELGDFLHQNAGNQVKAWVDFHNNIGAPYWFVANMDELDRLGGSSIFDRREEGGTSLYYAYSSLFLAKALALKEGREELEKYIDVPAVWRGDLYYIQNLIYTIESGEGSPIDYSENPMPIDGGMMEESQGDAPLADFRGEDGVSSDNYSGGVSGGSCNCGNHSQPEDNFAFLSWLLFLFLIKSKTRGSEA